MAVRAGYFQGGLTEEGRPMLSIMGPSHGPGLNRKGGQEEAH